MRLSFVCPSPLVWYFLRYLSTQSTHWSVLYETAQATDSVLVSYLWPHCFQWPVCQYDMCLAFSMSGFATIFRSLDGFSLRSRNQIASLTFWPGMKSYDPDSCIRRKACIMTIGKGYRCQSRKPFWIKAQYRSPFARSCLWGCLT